MMGAAHDRFCCIDCQMTQSRRDEQTGQSRKGLNWKKLLTHTLNLFSAS
jgi:hypothetical protein